VHKRRLFRILLRLTSTGTALLNTRGVKAFLKKTAIAYGRDPSKKVKFWWYAIAVFFKNASTPRVDGVPRAR